MCGIVGAVTKLVNGFISKDTEIFADLLYADVLRGDDSTGTFLVENDGSVNVAKEASTAEQYMWDKEWDKMKTQAFRTGSAWIGHNRKATRGQVTDENAHPFIVENDIVLLHNGTMRGDHKKFADVEVDSHAIAHMIHKHNGDVEKALNELNAAYALVWYSVSKKELNFIRNKERPLHILETSNSYYFASEGRMLEWVVDRNTSGGLGKDEKAVLIPEHTLVQFKLEGRKWVKSEHKLDVKPPVVPTTTYHTSSHSGYPYGQQHHRGAPFRNGYYPGMQDDDAVVEYYRSMGHGTSTTDNTATPLTDDTVVGQFTQGTRIKVYEGEEQRAIEQAMTVTTTDFFETVNKIPYSAWERAIPFDYSYRHDDQNRVMGVWVYAKLEKNPDIFVRAFDACPGMEVQAMDEMMTSICTEDRAYMFKCEARQWRKIKENPLVNATHGWGMIYASSYAKIHTATDEANGDDYATCTC